MLIGTTPTYSWTLPVDESNIAKLKITFKQVGDIVLVKKKSDCEFNGKQLSVTLSQEDTFLFRDRLEHEIRGIKKGSTIAQVRGLDKNGKAIGTVPRHIGIVDCNDDEILTPDEVLE